ncbi:putative toxin-antitoxin system toxin component, PIN family [Allochromatium humboldtianum]|uniref:Putative toxin-antitoxin system toxin component, PIN family n=1 Tax=Allochromatium humboldtianum TaxID=504901 RepID=A0A850RMT2_9GAMM|nr:putative toxin-antitoxin system toxin component, PIN family [Allochromatium humboldtianum]NVZ10771.1 putative toxin-antitoxin system toxin component, PIN family [Allochromatium humboldtianum]
MSLQRVVLDTNCLVSALIFSRGRFDWLREAWQTKRFTALASHDTVSELLRLLTYPKFKLTREEQETLLADFLPYVETVKIDTTPESLPDIRDADDIIFLVLAVVGRADALVSGDGDIQAVRDQFHVPILTVAEFADWLQSH